MPAELSIHLVNRRAVLQLYLHWLALKGAFEAMFKEKIHLFKSQRAFFSLLMQCE